jgi:uncharacterized protein YecT (DUF1311 family)
MVRIALAFGVLVAACSASSAQLEFEPTPDERKAIAACLERVIGQPKLKQMAECIGIVADPCPNAPGANTFTIVACHMREQKIWDGYLNQWYGEVEKRLADDAAALTALKDAQRAWIAFRDAKCDYWEKRYAGGTFASVVTGDCMRVETGRRALEMRAIFDDLDH